MPGHHVTFPNGAKTSGRESSVEELVTTAMWPIFFIPSSREIEPCIIKRLFNRSPLLIILNISKNDFAGLPLPTAELLFVPFCFWVSAYRRAETCGSRQSRRHHSTL